MFMPTSLAILFLFITAAWTGIFAIAFARQKSAKKQSLLANGFWIGVPGLCMLAAAVLLLQAENPGMTLVEGEPAQAHDSLAEHKQECIRDAISPRIAAEGANAANFETAARTVQIRQAVR